jgi:hypothetical protein
VQPCLESLPGFGYLSVPCHPLDAWLLLHVDVYRTSALEGKFGGLLLFPWVGFSWSSG